MLRISTFVKAQNFSKTVGVDSTIAYVYDVGALIGSLNLPVVFGAVLTISVGALLTSKEEQWKKSWIGY